MAGVVVNVPIVHPAGIYAVKAAKAKRNEVAYQMEEAEEMIALQVKKLSCELEIAYKHLDQVGPEGVKDFLAIRKSMGLPVDGKQQLYNTHRFNGYKMGVSSR